MPSALAAEQVPTLNDPDRRPSAVLKLGRSPEAQQLAELLTSASPERRQAIISLAVNESLQLGVLKAALEFWPEDVPRPSSAHRDERQA